LEHNIAVCEEITEMSTSEPKKEILKTVFLLNAPRRKFFNDKKSIAEIKR
jgi:hypothetical protein